MQLQTRMKSRHGIKYLKALPKNVRTSLEDLYNSGKIQNIVLAETNDITPKDTGKLRRSAYRFKDYYNETSHNKISATVTYRGINERTGFNYAYIQEVRRYGNYTTPGTMNWYLLRGLAKAKPSVKAYTAAAVMEGINKGSKNSITLIKGR